MELLGLNPAGADPSAVVPCGFKQLRRLLSKLKTDPGRRVRMAADGAEPQGQITDLVIAKVKAELVALFQRIPFRRLGMNPVFRFVKAQACIPFSVPPQYVDALDPVNFQVPFSLRREKSPCSRQLCFLPP